MKKTVLRTIWWTITALYVAIVYATLGSAPGMWETINSFFGGKNDFLLYIIYAITGGAILFYAVVIKKEKSPLKYIALVLFIGIFFKMLKFTIAPVEKIHMGEYGLLGIMVYNALKIDYDRYSTKLYSFGAIICMILCAVDEVIQGILPNRVFDWRDIFMNAVSSILAMLVIRVNILEKTDIKRIAKDE